MHRDAGGRLVKTGFAVVGMGKLGGGELNFSSDVDLIYVYASDEGETRPAPGRGRVVSIPNEEYFEYLSRDLTKALTQGTQEGHVFRVDLRLRAEGSVGRLARPLAGYARYYQSRGQVWERLALLKAWPVAGDPALGKAFLRMVKPFVIGKARTAIGREEAAAIVAQVKAVKDMIDDKMEERGQGRRNVKLGTGGIREIEFTVQTVQVLCGRKLPGILDRSTLASLAKFQQAGLLGSATESALRRAYIFLRDVEHKLQMVYDLQTHALPDSKEEMARCAVRLGYGKQRKGLVRFNADLSRHRAFVNHVFQGLFGAPGRSKLLKTALIRRSIRT
jgi:glutamate-ammonia-ligase adenylyltransferase